MQVCVTQAYNYSSYSDISVKFSLLTIKNVTLIMQSLNIMVAS